MGKLIPLAERYERYINRTESCWLWTGPISSNGYPQMKVGRTGNGPIWLVHRWAYQHFVGAIHDGLLVLHRCDVKHCSNPAHLYVGTAKENARDAIERQRRPKHHKFGARTRKLTDDDVRAIRHDDRPNHVIGAAYDISEVHVYSIKGRRRKAHVSEDAPLAPDPKPLPAKRILIPGKWLRCVK